MNKHVPSQEAQQIYADLLASSWKSVEGYLTTEEAVTLIDLVLMMPKFAVVEIGSWKGKSTTLISKVMSYVGNTNPIYAIDPHQGYLTITKVKSPDTFGKFIDNVNKLSCTNVIPIRLESQDHEAINHIDHELGLLWIDGLHTYDAAKADLVNYWQFLTLNGVVAFHDMNRKRFYPELYALQEELVRLPALSNWTINQKLLKAIKTSEVLTWI